MPEVRRTFLRVWKPVLLVLASVTVILGVWRIWTHLSAIDVERISIQARDWREILLGSAMTDLARGDEVLDAVNWTGAGTVGGETQYLALSALGYPEPPAVLDGAMDITVKNVEIWLIDVHGWKSYVEYDPQSGLHYVRLYHTEPFEYIDYKPPFENVPEPLQSLVAYSSKAPETLHLRSPSTELCCKAVPSTAIFLADEPTTFSWNMRLGCQMVVSHEPTSDGGPGGDVYITERCPNGRSFVSPLEAENDKKSEFAFRVYSSPTGNRTALVIPRSYYVETDNLVPIEDTGQDYLLLIRVVKAEGILNVGAHPLSLEVHAAVKPARSELSGLNDLPLLELRPSTAVLEFTGLTGKAAVGLDTVLTDELSDVLIEFVGWPILRWTEDSIVTEDGSVRLQPMLSGTGEARSVRINGEQLILSRWEKLSPEIQGAIWGGIIAALVAFAVSLFETRRRRTNTEREIQREGVARQARRSGLGRSHHRSSR